MGENQLIVTKHGKKRVLGATIEIDGRPALGYMKNGVIEGYILWDDVCRQIYTKAAKKVDKQ